MLQAIIERRNKQSIVIQPSTVPVEIQVIHSKRGGMTLFIHADEKVQVARKEKVEP